MGEQQDRLAAIKGPRDLLYGPNTDPLHFVEIRLADLDWLVGECERLRVLHEELRLARVVIHELVWANGVTEHPRLRAALEAWGKADKVEDHPRSTSP